MSAKKKVAQGLMFVQSLGPAFVFALPASNVFAPGFAFFPPYMAMWKLRDGGWLAYLGQPQ